jgi:uncharacterized membrane protein YhdT
MSFRWTKLDKKHRWNRAAIAILLLCIAAFMSVGLLVADQSDPRDWMLYAIFVTPVLFLVVLWLALKRCSTGDFSGFRGLLFITAYMSIGVGGYSVIVAVPGGNNRYAAFTRGGRMLSAHGRGDEGPRSVRSRF